MENSSFNRLPEGEIIRKNVKHELARNSLLCEEEIEIDAERDEVILMGEVDSRDKNWLAEDIASDTFGDSTDDMEDFYEN